LDHIQEEEVPTMNLLMRLAVGLTTVVVAGATATPGSAGGNVLGTYTINDHGQGGWSGGPLYADGTVGGGGGISFGNGLEVGTVTGGTWASGPGPGTITLCLNVHPIKDPLGILASPPCTNPPTAGFPGVLPVTGAGPPLVFQGTGIRVNLQQH
jgi:hypothetical protein